MAAKRQRNITTYSRLMILMALLIIAAGLSIQSVQVNLFTQSDMDSRYSNAIAEQMAQALRVRLDDTRGLQLAASKHPYTLNALLEGDEDWLQTLKEFLPGSARVSVVDRMGTLGLYQQEGYAVQELVSKTLKGATMRFEAVKRDDQLVFFWATPIRDEEQAILGVLLVEYGKDWLSQFQAVTTQTLGRVIVLQYLDDDRTRGVKIFDEGESTMALESAVTVPINDSWYLSYLANNARPQFALLPLVAPWIGTLIAVCIALLIFALLQKREVARNQLQLLTYLRVLGRHGKAETPHFSLRIFDEVAQQMQHLVRGKQRQSSSSMPAASAAVDIQLEPVRRAAVTPPKVTFVATNTSTLLDVEEIDGPEKD